MFSPKLLAPLRATRECEKFLEFVSVAQAAYHIITGCSQSLAVEGQHSVRKQF